MPTPGPWITRSTATFDTGVIPGSVAESSGAITQFALGSLADGPAGRTTGRGSTFADACEGTNGAIHSSAIFFSDPATTTTIRNDTAAVDFWTTGQLGVLLAWPLIRFALVDLSYFGPWPPGAIDVEYEWPDGSAFDVPDNQDPNVLLAATPTLTTIINRAAVGVPVTKPRAMTLDMRQTASADLNWQPGATANGYAALDSEPAPATTDTHVTLTGALNVASRPTLSFPFTEVAYWHLLLHHHEQITHAAPAVGSMPPSPPSDIGWGGSLSFLYSVQVTGTYQPPRYRFVFSAPAYQRTFPRDDGLGASSARSWPPSISTQSGPRSGPTAIT